MVRFLENYFGVNRFQPDASEPTKHIDFDQETLANLVAVIAFGLPVVLLIGAAFPAVCFHTSISGFYYSRFLGGVFVGSVSIIAVLLLAYRGQGKRERNLATLGAFLAILVAWMPTKGPKCETGSHQFRAFLLETASKEPEYTYSLSEFAGNSHLVAAALFFLLLAYFAAFVFTREVEGVHKEFGGNKLSDTKARRNKYYRRSAFVIVGCVAVIGLSWLIEIPFWNELRLTFVFEAIALCAFGFSWLVKGRNFGKGRIFNVNIADDAPQHEHPLS